MLCLVGLMVLIAALAEAQTENYWNIIFARVNVIICCPFAVDICCPRDCVSRHNGGTSGAPLKPLRDDSALIPIRRNTCLQ